MQNPVFLMVFEITSKSGQNKVKLAAKHFKNHGFEPVFCGNSTKINGKMVKSMVPQNNESGSVPVFQQLKSTDSV